MNDTNRTTPAPESATPSTCPTWCETGLSTGIKLLDHANGDDWMDDPGDPSAPGERWHAGPTFGQVRISAMETEGRGLADLRFTVSIDARTGGLGDQDAVEEVQTPDGMAALDQLLADLGRARDWVVVHTRPETSPAATVAAFPGRVAALMESRGVSMRELADAAGLRREVFSRRMHESTLTVEQVAAVARVLGVEPWDLLA